MYAQRKFRVETIEDVAPGLTHTSHARVAVLFFFTFQIHEHDELMWDDGVAPETCIDFDAPHVSSYSALLWLAGGLGFFGGLGYMVSLTDPVGKNPALPRELPFDGLKRALGEGDGDAESPEE